LLDFLSSVCVSGGRGHERIQTWITQLMCGIVSEGIDPHASSLIYQLRIISREVQGRCGGDMGRYGEM
jgi:hypothetical protein